MSIQVGTNDNEVIKFSLDKTNTETLGVSSDKLFETTPAGIKGVTSIGDDIDADKIGVATGTKYATGITSVKEYKVDGVASADKVVLNDGTKDYVVNKSDFKLKGADEVEFTGAKTTEFKADPGKDMPAGLEVKDDALATLDAAINKVDESRSKLGAIQNRFQSTINNLNNSVNNLSAARSRIQDADFATEVSNMSRGQILQQAGTAVLAQANQVPQGVLSLLR